MKVSKSFILIVVCLGLCTVLVQARPQHTPQDSIGIMKNPMRLAYLQKHLLQSQPRLILNSSTQAVLEEKLKSDQVVQNLYQAIQLNAESILNEPLLKREQIGMRLLHVSREMLYRINMLGLVYRMEQDASILARINEEVMAVCHFSDWNPSHFLDVAEMSLAVALALDWTAGALPESTIELAQSALIEKALIPSWTETDGYFPFHYPNNWNQVCNGGMIAAAIAVAGRAPELATKTISRALDGLPHAMAEYGPDGVYPEGSSYWEYATAYSVLTIAMLESAFGHDFGYSEFPGFMESAVFRTLSNAPSGWYYNFADCADQRSSNGDLILAWFASKSGNKTFFEETRFLRSPEEMGRLERWAGAALVWVAGFEEISAAQLPTAWKGDGPNPVVIFRDEDDTSHQYYFGGKGGRGQVANHGNMDGGSFVFELDGVRWSVDPGRQPYHELEKIGFDLWNMCQDCERWTLLAQNNFGHSTISVNDQLHLVEGFAPIVDFHNGAWPFAMVDLTAAFGSLVKKASRKFTRDSDRSLLIEDDLVFSPETEWITWQMMTTADIELNENGATLRQNGELLKLEILSHPDLSCSVVSLSPAPLSIDKKIDNLKRLEIRIPVWLVDDQHLKLKVRLSGAD